MSKLDQPLRLKHGLAAAVAILTVGIAGTAIAGGAGQKDAIRASATPTGGGGGGALYYRVERRSNVPANSQRGRVVDCPPARRLSAAGSGALRASPTAAAR